MNWIKKLYAFFTDKPISEEEIGVIIGKAMEEYRKRPRVFCKDCINIHRPRGWLLDDICPESECLAGGNVNYVTGKTEYWLCKYQNSEGFCQNYKAKETPCTD